MKAKNYWQAVFLLLMTMQGCKLKTDASAVKEVDTTNNCDQQKALVTTLEKQLADAKARQNANCTSKGGFVNTDGACLCKDNTPVFKIGNKTCDEFMGSSTLTSTSTSTGTDTTSELCSSKGGSTNSDNTCRCPDGTPVYKIGGKTCAEFAAANGTSTTSDTYTNTLIGLSAVSKVDMTAKAPTPYAPSLDGNDDLGFGLTDDLDAIQKQLDDAKSKYDNCQKQLSRGSDGCTAAGGTQAAGDDTCRCSNGTPVFKIGNKTCSAYLGKTSPDCAAKKGLQADGEDTCRCSDGTAIFKIGNQNCEEFVTAQNPGCKAAGGIIHAGDADCVCPDGVPVFKKSDKKCEAPTTTSTSTAKEYASCPGDQDCDGIKDANDFCKWTPKGERVWQTGSWAGCAQGQYRDNTEVGPPKPGASGNKCVGDTDCDGIPDAQDRCSHSPLGANVWASGDFMGCASGESRDK